MVLSASLCSCLQYVNGGSLESLLQDHSTLLSWTVRVQLAKDIAVGVAYLHKNGILHRDLNTRVSFSLVGMYTTTLLHTLICITLVMLEHGIIADAC